MGAHDGEPILDLEAWRAGSGLDREAWTLAAKERLLGDLERIIATCRRDFYDPSDPTDWSVPNLEFRIAGVEVAIEKGDHVMFLETVARFLETIPPRMADAIKSNRKEKP